MNKPTIEQKVNLVLISAILIEVIIFGVAYKKSVDIVQYGKFWVW